MRCLYLLFVICFCLCASLAVSGAEETSVTKTESETTQTVQKPLIPFRRKYIRKRLLNLHNDGDRNYTTSVSVSVSKSSSGSSEPVKHRIFSRVNRPKLIIQKNAEGGATSTTLQVGGTQESVVETPNSSFRQKRPIRPLVKATLRKLYRPTIRTAEESQPKAEVSTTTTTTTASTTIAPSTETTTSTTTTLEPQTTTTTTTIATTTESSSTTTEESSSPSSTIVTEVPKNAVKTTPKNMIIIPVPPSQRRPYHPVIMQVTKSPSVSSTEKPQTRVVTYKLNKMFVPMGIYGKVLPKSEIEAANAANGVSSTSSNNDEGQVQEQEQPQQDATQTLSSGITAEIRHKGTSSEELITSDDSSGDFGTAVNHPSTIPLTADDAVFPESNWMPFNPSARKQKNKQSKQFFDASQVDLTTNYKPDISKISLTTQKPRIDQISLTTTEMTPFFGPVTGNGNRRGNYQNQMTHMGPPKPFEKTQPQPSKSIVESIKSAAANAASSIPGFLHGGLTHLSQMNLPNPLEEVLFGSSEKTGDSASSASSVISSIFNPTTQGDKKVTIGAPDDETLEYFRKRPHLINNKNNHFSQPSYASGFKPSVSLRPSFAKAYFASTTTTTPSPSTTASSYRKEKEYESNRASLLLRSPKNFQDAWKKEKSESYVDQLIESSNRYKYTATPPSLLESDIIKSHWNTMNEKYTKNEIDEAKQRIYDMFSGPTPPNLEQMLYMQPPGELSRSSSSAFQDLLKMFRLGFSFGTSSSSSTRKPYTRSFGVGNLRSTSASNEDDGWRPIKSGSGGSGSSDSIVSFNAQISIGSTPKPTPLYPGHGGTHYSSSSKPYNPKPTVSHGLKSSGSHSSSFYSHTTPSPTSSYRNNHYRGGSSSSHSSKYPGPPPSSSGEYSDVYYSGGSMGENGETYRGKDESSYRVKDEDSYKPPSSLSSLYESDPGLELIPSNLFLKQKEQGIDVGEIAAVLKPSGMNEDSVRAQLPQEDFRNVPQISYPEDKPNAVSQIQQYFQSSEPAPQNSVHFQPPLLRLIQQTMDSQREQLGHHKHNAGLLLNHQLSQSLKVPVQTQEEEPVAPHPLSSPSSASSSSHNQYYSAEQSQPQAQTTHHHQQQQQLPAQFTLSQLGFSGLGLSGLTNTGHRFQINQDLLQQYRPASIEQQQQQPQIQHHHHEQQSQQIQQHHHHEQPQQIQHHHHVQQPQIQQHHHHVQQQPQQQHQHQHYAQQQQQQQPGSVSLKTTGDSGLGFTDFELPAGVDPDIAALLKAELDKDDIPEEFRKEFQEQEKAKAKKQQQAAASAPVPVRVRPTAKTTTSASRRQDVHVKTVFHKPIPISPTLITPNKGRAPSRPPPNIPKYVLDLAKKLRNDKDLQGIVRVTSKKSNGVPIEYLYPVRG